MDDGFILLPKNDSIDIFRDILNVLHPALKFKSEKGEK